MKKIKTILGAMVLSSFVFFTTPVSAQTQDSSVTTSRTTDDNHSDNGKWGLLGLLGLAGLLGFKKKDNQYNATDASVRNRP